MTSSNRPPWFIFGVDADKRPALPPVPPWRSFAATKNEPPRYITTPEIEEAVNAALYLRRPLLVTGGPGTGKSTLAREIALQLGAERYLKWPINSRSTLGDALYRYDAINRLRDASLGEAEKARANDIGLYLSLGPLGTAIAPPPEPGKNVRVLLIDEIDKSNLDLPNDLLDILEDGSFVIPELRRMKQKSFDVRVDAGKGRDETVNDDVTVVEGLVSVKAERYPFIVLTSNGERDFSPAFRRRCVALSLDKYKPSTERVVERWLGALDEPAKGKVAQLIKDLNPDASKNHSTDQLLNLAFMLKLDRQIGKEDTELARITLAVAPDLDQDA